MPLQATSGAASYDAFGGGVPVVPNYIEDVFSTFLYTGNETARTIVNGIDVSTKGGLVWCKSRNTVSTSWHNLFDTGRGNNQALYSNSTSASTDYGSGSWSPATTGFNLGDAISAPSLPNRIGDNYVSWTFRKQPKFFDVVTYTGNGTAGRQIAHNLGSAPGFMVVKSTSQVSTWAVYHRSIDVSQYVLALNTTDAQFGQGYWNYTAPTSSVFTVGSSGDTNQTGQTYVAYLFAHNAGGFGLTGTDNVISCGSYTGTGAAGNNITLGYEPQWVMLKRTDTTGAWFMHDVMRGMPLTNSYYLTANTSSAETEGGIPIISPTATGFQMETGIASWNASGGTYIYIAIRRGPMKVPTSGTSVFALGGSAITGSSTLTTSFPVDAFIQNSLTSDGANSRFASRLQGSNRRLVTSNTNAEAADNGDSQFGGASYKVTGAGGGVVYGMQRAPSFFDVVCYTGNGVNGRTITHNLSVTPELIIVKNRTTAGTDWPIRCSVALTTYKEAFLNLTNETNFWSYIQDQSSTTFTVGNDQLVNYSAGDKYVAYLFATCAGVSKVGSYTGTGTTKQIDCGFTGGARFVLIKKTSGTGSWYVWDSSRGIVSGNDPYLLLNSTAAEVTNTDYIDTYSAGFEISSTAPSEINESGGSFIFLAIA